MGLCEKTKELIAIGASIAANCQPCLDYHADKAREHGAGESEIAEAIEVGKLVRKGAAGKMDKYVLHLTKDPAAETAPDGSCGG